MRVLVSLALASSLLLLATALTFASDGVSEAHPVGATKVPASPIPHGVPWFVLPMLGYISMELKRQVRRRGFLSGDRAKTFSDLISLGRPRGAGDATRSSANAAASPTRPDGDPR